MHWILQTNVCGEENWNNLVKSLERLGISYSIHKVIPFICELTDPPVLSDNNAILIGSYSLRHYAKKHNLVPGVFDLEPYDFQQQLQHWGDHMLNADSIVTEFKNANPTDDFFFCRPVLDSKSFSGAVFSKEEFYEWKRKIVVLGEDYGSSLDGASVIQISSLKKIFAEYRFFIVNGKISTASKYKQGDKLLLKNIDVELKGSELEAFVLARLSEWQPLPSFCIDIAETPNGLKVVEINTINSSGFYDIDVQKFINDMEEAFTIKGDQLE